MDEIQKEEEPSTVKASFISNDHDLKYEPKDMDKSSGKGILLIIGLFVVLAVGGFFLNQKFKILPGSGQLTQPTPSDIPIPITSPTPQAVIDRSEWSFEILNGSGVTGAAKKLAEEIQTLGYSVVKTGNADKDSYSQTQISVREDLLEKVDLVIADLKDTLKIASVAGELAEGTASARIIIGKDAI